jgi:hypothetical protein
MSYKSNQFQNGIDVENFSQEEFTEFNLRLIDEIMEKYFNQNNINIELVGLYFDKKLHIKSLNQGHVFVFFTDLKKNKLTSFVRFGLNSEIKDSYLFRNESELSGNKYMIVNHGYPINLYFDWKYK